MNKFIVVFCLVCASFYAIAGTVTTCTNSCVITHHSNGSITIRDCCGGRVITTMTTQEP